MFSKTFGYALRAVTFVAIHGKDGKKVSLHELSGSLGIPYHFLGKIMQDIVRHGIIDSTKGPSGGFFRNAQTLDTLLLDILKITDGNLVFEHCALGIQRCNESYPCSLHDDFANCRNGMLRTLSVKTIGMIAGEIEEGATFLVR